METEPENPNEPRPRIKQVIGHEFIRGQSVIVPNLLTIFQRLAYNAQAPSLVSLDQIYVFSMPMFANESHIKLQDYSSLARLKLLLYEKPNRQQHTLKPLQSKDGLADQSHFLYTFRNYRSGSRLTLFLEATKPLVISYQRTEAAVLLDQHHFALVLSSFGQSKLQVAERTQAELTPLCEHVIDGGSHDWFEIKTFRSNGSRYLGVFYGAEKCPTSVELYSIDYRHQLTRVSKKLGVCRHGRIRPILVQQSTGLETGGFYVVGGKKGHFIQTECYTDYEYFPLAALMDDNTPLKTTDSIKDLTNPPIEVAQSLWNGIQLARYVMVPGCNTVFQWKTTDKPGELTIQTTDLRHQLGRNCEHIRLLHCEFSIVKDSHGILDFVHVCKTLKERVLARNRLQPIGKWSKRLEALNNWLGL